MSWVDLVDAISADVVASLVAGGYPPLVGPGILCGPEHLFEQSYSPRVVFVPLGSTFPGKDVYSRQASPSSAERRSQAQLRSIRSEFCEFEAHVWGQRPTLSTDVRYDYAATQVLYQQVIRSVHLIAIGSYDIGKGKWTRSTNLVRSGQEFVFPLTLFTPVVDALIPYAPSDTSTQGTISLDIGDGSPEVAAVIVNS